MARQLMERMGLEMKSHFFNKNNNFLFWGIAILLTVLTLTLCSCKKTPSFTVYMGPSKTQYSTDELKVKDGKYQEALKRCQERLEQVKEDSAEEADVYRDIGGIYAEYVRDKDLAIQNINKAIDIDERNKDEIGLAEDYTVMSSIYIYVGGEAEDGLAYLDKAEQIYKMYNLNSFGLAGVLMNKSRLYQDEGKLDEALKMLKEAQKIYDQKQEKDYVLHLLTGGVYLEKNEYKFAEEQYIEAQKICESKNDQYGLAATQDQLGWLYGNMKEYEKTIESYKKALDFYKRDSIYVIEVAAIYNNMADCYTDLYEADKTIDASIVANKLIRSIKQESSRTEKKRKFTNII